MKIPRYYQQEQYTDRSSTVFQPQPFVSPLETIGQGVSNILERTVAQDQQAYLAEESAKAQAKVFDIADGLEAEIQDGDILDQKTLEETFRTRVDESFDELQLTSKVRKNIQPDVIRLMSVNGLKLNKVLANKRADIEAASLNDSIDTFKRKAVEAQTAEELNSYLDLIRGTVAGVEGTFLDEKRKQAFLSGTLDFIHSSRTNWLLLNPANDPNDIKTYLENRKGEISPETREKLLRLVESRIQGEQENERYYDIFDAIREARKNDSKSLDSIRQNIEDNKKYLSREVISNLSNQVDSIEIGRKAESAELVVNRINEALAIDKDYERAKQIAEKHQMLLGQDGYEDELLKIQLAQKSEPNIKEMLDQSMSISKFGLRIDQGEFDSLDLDQMGAVLENEVTVNRSIPLTGTSQLLKSWMDRQHKLSDSKIQLQIATGKIQTGAVLDKDQTDLVYQNFENDPQDENWMNREVRFAADTAKNIPTAWKDRVKSAALTKPTTDSIQTIDLVADYVSRLQKDSPVYGELDKQSAEILSAYKARVTPDMSAADKVKAMESVWQAKNATNRDHVQNILSSNSYKETVDRYWNKEAGSWYEKYAEQYGFTNTEYFRNDPEPHAELKSLFEAEFRRNLFEYTADGQSPNYDHAAKNAFHHLFSQWQITEADGKLRWAKHPVDKWFHQTAEDQDEYDYMLDQFKKELLDTVKKSELVEPSYSLMHFLFDINTPYIETTESRISLNYIEGTENTTKSGIPNYQIVVDEGMDYVGIGSLSGDDIAEKLTSWKNQFNTINRAQAIGKRVSYQLKEQKIQDKLERLPEDDRGWVMH